MRKNIMLLSLCLLGIKLWGQNKDTATDIKINPSSIIDLPDKGRIGFTDINSSAFIRILDGVELKKDYKIPKGLSINNIRTLSAADKLEELGLVYTGTPYMILNTSVNSIRRYIKNKTTVPYGFYGRNLPIILNGDLITPNQYSLLNDLDTNSIHSISFLKDVPKQQRQGFKMPWGAIIIRTNR